MRLSQLFFSTLRDDPADAEMPSHRLLVRAGYVRQLGTGIYSLLPLGFRVNKRVEQIVREEQDRIGAQEMEMPVVHPAEVWKQSGRYYKIGPELLRFKDRTERDMVLAFTHEEIVALLLRDLVQSYRQLPMMVYHFQTKFRDEPRSRGGLIRVREFVMKDAYSCDRDEAGLDVSYWAQHAAYERIFERLGLETIAVSSDVGMMGGSLAHEFMVLNPAGEDVLVLCESCGYAANRQVASIPKPEPAAEDLAPLDEVATPGTTTIATLARGRIGASSNDLAAHRAGAARTGRRGGPRGAAPRRPTGGHDPHLTGRPPGPRARRPRPPGGHPARPLQSTVGQRCPPRLAAGQPGHPLRRRSALAGGAGRSRGLAARRPHDLGAGRRTRRDRL
jgi:prolyl-tRNA synthetase